MIFIGRSLLSHRIATPVALSPAPQSSTDAVPFPNMSLLQVFPGISTLPFIRGNVNLAKTNPSSQETGPACCVGWEGLSHLLPASPAFLVPKFPCSSQASPAIPGLGPSCLLPRSRFLPAFWLTLVLTPGSPVCFLTCSDLLLFAGFH